MDGKGELQLGIPCRAHEARFYVAFSDGVACRAPEPASGRLGAEVPLLAGLWRARGEI
jgi:hypothetical protein